MIKEDILCFKCESEYCEANKKYCFRCLIGIRLSEGRKYDDMDGNINSIDIKKEHK